MTTLQILLLVIGLFALVVGGLAIAYYTRHRQLRRRFGPEYDRLASGRDGPLAVDRELRERERRHAELQLRELDPETRTRYAEQWQRVQAGFAESPEAAIGSADELVTRLIRDRGYPAGDYDQQLTLLSVEHARVVDDYRVAHDIAQQHARGNADTEMLRQALLHYRTLVADILGTDAGLKAEAMAHKADSPSGGTVYGGGARADKGPVSGEARAEDVVVRDGDATVEHHPAEPAPQAARAARASKAPRATGSAKVPQGKATDPAAAELARARAQENAGDKAITRPSRS
jgi:hypothetical protein